MAKGVPRRYFDSNTIVRFVENHVASASVVEALLKEAKAGAFTVVVCANSLVEVTRDRNRPVDPAKRAKILEFFENPYIFVRDVDQYLAESALELIYGYLWLRPMDAVHLAAAIDTNCEIFYTFDLDIIGKFNGEKGLSVAKPTVPSTPTPSKPINLTFLTDAAPSMDALIPGD